MPAASIPALAVMGLPLLAVYPLRSCKVLLEATLRAGVLSEFSSADYSSADEESSRPPIT